MLRKLRISLAVLFFLGITLMLLDFTGTLHAWLGWMAKLQFLPAVLALNFAVIALMVVLTLLFGRIYCSVICPLGVWQDLVSNLSGRRKGKKLRFTHSPERKWLRYGIWVLFVLAIILGVNSFVALLAPYSAWGRIVQNLLSPLVLWGNNLLAKVAEKAGSYAFYGREVWLRSLPTLLVALAMLVLVTVLAWRGGRTYCNTVCPVGTTLSFLSRFAAFRPVIDSSKCKNCKVCERKCKASCIDISSHKIDYSRCVDCFNCLDNCKFGALHYKFAWGSGSSAKGPSADAKTVPGAEDGAARDGRRAFLASSALLATSALKAQQKKVDGGLATILPKQKPVRETPLTPFGSLGVKEFYSHCTACQLCVSACPNNVLRPSSKLGRLMQPELSYERGYCRPECVRCSEVCPAGAILPITPEEKTSFKIGTARVERELCVVSAKGVSCGNCARHCPVGAISLVRMDPQDKDSLMIPAVNEELCIGCGACENLCPSRPLSAIRVEGLVKHIKG